jgi:hypothetical protein
MASMQEVTLAQQQNHKNEFFVHNNLRLQRASQATEFHFVSRFAHISHSRHSTSVCVRSFLRVCPQNASGTFKQIAVGRKLKCYLVGSQRKSQPFTFKI